MTAVLPSLRICGNILSTEIFSYFEFRCAFCDANFNELAPLIEHLQRWHGKREEEQLNQDATTANELEWKAEELKEEEIIYPEEYIDNSEVVEENKDEVDFLRSDGEASEDGGGDYADFSPDADKVKRENEDEDFLELIEKGWTDNDEAEQQAKLKRKTRAVGASAGTRSSSKKQISFLFNLDHPDYKKISQEFLKLLEARPCLWNTTVKSRYGTKPERIAARNEIKFQIRDLGYRVSDKKIVSIISRILQEHKDAEQQATQNAGAMDERLMLILENCKFLKDRVEMDPADKEKNVKRVLRKKVKSLDARSNGNESEEEKVAKKVMRKKPKREKSLEEPCSNGDDEVKEEILAENSDDDSGTSECSDNSDVSPKSKSRPVVVASKIRKNNLPYKRIQFLLMGNKVASDFIDQLRGEPILWDGSNPDYRNKVTRQQIFESWIPHFQQQHNVTFNYDDFNENWIDLRRFLMKRVKSLKRLSKASIALREQLSFLSKRNIAKRIKCEHCDRFAMSDRGYQHHLYQSHGIGDCPLKCDECGGREFRTSSELNIHMKQSHPRVERGFPCNFCDRKFTQYNNMLRHAEMHTGVVMHFVCPTCGQGFRRKENLIAHEVRIHLRQRNFACSMCPKAFYTKGLLKDHINVHLNIRRFKCPTCDKGFHSSHSLMRHKQIHTEIKRYACKLCDARFHQFVGLNAHMKNRHQFVHHQQQQQQQVDSDMEDSVGF